MSSFADWVPMKWPCGPLEIELRQKQAPLDDPLRASLNSWLNPSTLDLIEKTPVNCLILRWAAGVPQDQEQQANLKPLLTKGRELGISFVGIIEGSANQETALGKAMEAGLSAVLMPGGTRLASKIPIFETYGRSTLSSKLTSPLLACEDAIWPRLRSNVMAQSDTIVAGPTGVPWVDSNGWYIQLTRTLTHDKPLWLMFDPPRTTAGFHVESYLLALADTRSHGAHWTLSLDDPLRSELANRNSAALAKWKSITEALKFFQSRQEWNGFSPKSVLAVFSDFSGSNEFLGGEVLNLLGRRQVAFSIVEKKLGAPAALEGMKAVLWVDQEPPNKEESEHFLGFVEKGGLLIIPKTWGKIPAKVLDTELDGHYEIFGLGKGRVAMATSETEDPYELAERTHLLLSRRNDLFRLWNAGSFNSYLTTSTAKKKTLLQLINYAGRNSDDRLSIWVRGNYSHSQVWTPGCVRPTVLNGVSTQEGQEFHLPPIDYYVAIEMDNLI
ncbi:MAG: hypothetical protein U0V70_02020 [Terriglobia bacterium]